MALPTIKKNKEVWKDIKGYKGIYQVSNMGRVRSLDRMVPHDRTGKHGTGQRRIKGRMMSTKEIKTAYLTVTLSRGRPSIPTYVHRLVIETFVPRAKGKRHCNHIDGNKHNNKLSNLEWSNKRENAIHAVKMGLIKICKPIKCVQTGKEYASIGEAAKDMGIHRVTLQSAVKRGNLVYGKYRFERV